MRPLRAALLSLFISAAAFGQASEVIEVRVTNVDVVVTDRAGKPVTGLTKQDFQLFEDGKLQSLTNFYEVRSDIKPASPASPEVPVAASESVVPAESRRRSILVFVDNTSVPQFRRNRAAETIRNGLGRLLRPGDDASIVSWNRSPAILQPFTTDRALLERAVSSIEKSVSGAGTLSWEKSQVVDYAASAQGLALQGLTSSVPTKASGYSMAQAYSDSLAKWRTYALKLEQSERMLLGSVGQMLSTLEGGDGKKIVIFVGAQLDDRPGVDVLERINNLFGNAVVTTPALLEASGMSLDADLRRLAARANSRGVTLYLVDVGDRGTDMMRDLPDRSADFLADSSAWLSMGQLASATGGSVVSGTNNFDVAIDNISRDLGSYYSLGYRPATDGRPERKLSVKVNRPGVSVRSRQTYVLKTGEDEVSERVVSNAFHDAGKSDFEVSVTLGTPVKDHGNFKVPVTVTFPSDLTYIPEGENLTGEYAVVFATAGPNGELSQVTRQEKKVRFPAESYFEIKEKPFTHTATLLVRPGKQSVSIAVVDKLGARTGYATATIDAR